MAKTKPISASDISDGIKAISDQLSDEITAAVTKANRGTARKIAAAVRRGDFADAQRMTRDLQVGGVMDRMDKPLRRFSRSVAMLGAGAVDRPSTSLWAQGAPFPREVDIDAPEAVKASMKDAVRGIQSRMEERVVAASRFQKMVIDPNKLAKQINQYLRGEIRRVVDAGANATGTRLAAFGMLHEARVRGFTRYRLDATLDERTTDICREMDGRTFTVEESYVRTQHILGLSNPNDIKQAAPFPDIEKIRGKSDDELRAMGHTVPPFHFLCRTVVTLIESDQVVEADPINYALFDAPTLTEREATTFFRDRSLAILASMTGDRELAKDLVMLEMHPRDALREDPKRLAQAVKDYTGSYYATVNAALRSNNLPEYDVTKFKETTRKMDEFFERETSRLEEDVIVYRGLRDRSLGERIASTEAVGKVFQDDGFWSTSVDREVAERFGGRRVLVKILVPKGTPAAMADPYSNHVGEREIVLARGTQLRVIGSEQDERNQTIIKAVVVGRGEVLDPDDIGVLPKPDAEHIQRALRDVKDGTDKFSWTIGDLREATLL